MRIILPPDDSVIFSLRNIQQILFLTIRCNTFLAYISLQSNILKGNMGQEVILLRTYTSTISPDANADAKLKGHLRNLFRLRWPLKLAWIIGSSYIH